VASRVSASGSFAETTDHLPLAIRTRVKAGPLEAEFEREIRELRTSAEATTSSQPPAKPSWQEEVERLAQVNPRSAIMEAWRQTENALIRTLRANDPSLRDRDVSSTREVLRLLGERGTATPKDVAMLNQIMFLRNQAVHVESFQPTYDAAMNFVRLAGEVISRVAFQVASPRNFNVDLPLLAESGRQGRATSTCYRGVGRPSACDPKPPLQGQTSLAGFALGCLPEVASINCRKELLMSCERVSLRRRGRITGRGGRKFNS
jgi:hypothetical protein